MPFGQEQRKRIRFFKYQKKFVNKPASECGLFELPMINGDDLDREINSADFVKCFTLLLVDTFKTFMKTGEKDDAPEEVLRGYDIYNETETSNPIEIFNKDFEITKCKNHHIPAWKIKNFVEKNVDGMNEGRFKDLLTHYAGDTHNYDLTATGPNRSAHRTTGENGEQGINLRCWFGIRERPSVPSYEKIQEACQGNDLIFDESLEEYQTETANNLYTYKPAIAIASTNTTMFEQGEKTLEEWLVENLGYVFKEDYNSYGIIR